MLSVLSVLTLSMFFYANTIYYTLALLVIVLLLLSSLASSSSVHTLTMLMFLIVYLGAIIILIGYICAISPNFTVNPYFSIRSQLLALVFFITLFLDIKSWSFSDTTSDHLTGYFYSPFGVVPLTLVIFMLFITLLMVTSQYLAPKGPFRSISL